KPSVVRKLVAIGTICDVNIAVQKQQGWPLQMLLRDKWHAPIDRESRIGAGNGALNLYGPAKLLRPGGEADSMQPMNNASIFAGGNSHIQSAGRGINDRGAANTDFRRNQSIG